MALGELHGRKLDSALMWGRVHNRISDRGGKPIRLAWPWAQPPVHPEDRGPFACLSARSPCRALFHGPSALTASYREPIAATSMIEQQGQLDLPAEFAHAGLCQERFARHLPSGQ